MNQNGNIVFWAFWCVVATLAGGCHGPDTSASLLLRPSVRIDDPCAERLHDICGQLLQYHGIYRKLPAALADLQHLEATKPPPLVCPVSGQPYIYNPEGLQIPDRPGRLVLYDPMPSHSGMRWGVFVSDPASGKAVTTRVVLLSETPALSAGKQHWPEATRRD